MHTKTFSVPNIGCEGCVRAIKNELSKVPGVLSIEADAASKMVTVAWDEIIAWDAIRARLIEIDYPPEELITL